MKPHIKFDDENLTLNLLDQRFLPEAEKFHVSKTADEVIEAIQNMVVRGAPAIGVAAAYGCILALNDARHEPDWRKTLAGHLEKLATARPTAINLSWSVKRMRKLWSSTSSWEDLFQLWKEEAKRIHLEDEKSCRALGKTGAPLIKDGDTVLTHCNAGALATGGYGTALGIIRAAAAEGKKIRVIADETRPLMQGSRLTAWELIEDRIPVTVVCDSASALLMEQGKVDLVIVGADRVAANGDTANKIGTLGLAIIANYFKIPFYVACPISTFDINLATGDDIPIEERAPEEVSHFGERLTAPEKAHIHNFAFDVTPGALISALITEKGIIKPPYLQTVASLFSTEH